MTSCCHFLYVPTLNRGFNLLTTWPRQPPRQVEINLPIFIYLRYSTHTDTSSNRKSNTNTLRFCVLRFMDFTFSKEPTGQSSMYETRFLNNQLWVGSFMNCNVLVGVGLSLLRLIWPLAPGTEIDGNSKNRKRMRNAILCEFFFHSTVRVWHKNYFASWWW